MIINQLVKGFKEALGWKIFEILYNRLNKLRKNKPFNLALQASFAFICHHNTFFSWNHREIA